MSNMLSERGNLSATGSERQLRTLNVVICAVAALSAAGAAFIILSFALFKQVRTFRHQLILGLGISDFLMALNFMSSSALNLSKRSTLEKTPQKFCSFNGYMIQVFVVQTDYWVLTIAVCTFLILANYKSQSSWIQEHRIILWCLPWGFSALWASLGLAIVGYGDIGAWCWFTSDEVRLLVNFVPRWLIIIVMLALYGWLFRIIKKAHSRFRTFEQDLSRSLEPETESVSSTRRIGRPTTTNTHLNSKDHDVEVTGRGRSGLTQARGPQLKKMAYQMMSYPVAYMVIWTIPTSIRIYQVITGKAAPFGLATVDKACIVIQGFADAMIYGVNESSLHIWRDRFSSKPPTSPTPNIVVTTDVNVSSTRRRQDEFDMDNLSRKSSVE